MRISILQTLQSIKQFNLQFCKHIWQHFEQTGMKRACGFSEVDCTRSLKSMFADLCRVLDKLSPDRAQRMKHPHCPFLLSKSKKRKFCNENTQSESQSRFKTLFVLERKVWVHGNSCAELLSNSAKTSYFSMKKDDFLSSTPNKYMLQNTRLMEIKNSS